MLPERLQRFAQPAPILNHGHIQLLDVMGDDSAIVIAGRTSTTGERTEHKWDSGHSVNGIYHYRCTACGIPLTTAQPSSAGIWPVNKRWCEEGDRLFIRSLMRRRHTTPFEMCEIKLHVKLPIFVARQWIRHRTANVNEYSSRYSSLDDEYYVPELWRIQGQGGDENKQGSGESFDGATAAAIRDSMNAQQADAFVHYNRMLKGHGLAKELARIPLSVGTYTKWVWKIDLHNLLHFMGLRFDHHAQYEIRIYAEAMAEIIKAWVPYAWEAFEDYRFYAHTFSRQEMTVLRGIVRLAALQAKEVGNLDEDPMKSLLREIRAYEPWQMMTKRERGNFLRAAGVID